MKSKALLLPLILVGLIGCEGKSSKKNEPAKPNTKEDFLKKFSGQVELEDRYTSGARGKMTRFIDPDGKIRVRHEVNSRCKITAVGNIDSVELQPYSTANYNVKYVFTGLNYFVKPCAEKEFRIDMATCQMEVDRCYREVSTYQDRLNEPNNEYVGGLTEPKSIFLRPVY